MTAFPISLVFPPQAHATQPYLALPCIKAWLHQEGFDDVELLDANVEAYDRFLSPDYLRWAVRRAEARTPLASFEGLDELPYERLADFRVAAEVAVAGHAAIEEVDAAKAALRGEAFYDPTAYVHATRTLYHALRTVSAAWSPSQLTAHNFTMRWSIDRSREVLAALDDEEANPFLSHFREAVLPRLVARRPRLVGLSIIYGSQLIPALTLGKLIKQALPDCHVTAGGGFLAYIADKLLAAPHLAVALDSVVYYEGERPMAELARALRAGDDLAGVESLGWFRRGADGAALGVKNAMGHPIALDAAPAPDFDGLPLDLYLSPETVLPYDVNRGCYYGECSFCTLPTVIGPGYRTRKAETIASQVKGLKQRYGTRNFTFVTDCLPPGMIADLPEALIAAEADVRWWCDARVEPRAYTPEGCARLYESGCRKLLFGFETAVPRLLKLMKKGQSTERTLEVATNCDRAGISVTFYAMVGFPSETREEARATLRFLVDNAADGAGSGVVREVSLQTFHLDEVAEVFRDPETYGLEVLHDEAADLDLYHDYRANSGMSQLEAAEAFDEMMASLRAAFPLFRGDAIFWFMQKSHYFLHLARDVTPDAFLAGLRAAGLAGGEAAGVALEADQLGRLAPAPGLRRVRIPFSYRAAVERLAHPWARAARPDFLTGRYVPDLDRRAAEAAGPLPASERVLAYAPGSTEFVELSPDGDRIVGALAASGRFDTLVASLGAPAGEPRAHLDRFARDLHVHGLLRTS